MTVITIAGVSWKDAKPHLTLGDIVSHTTIGHYRLTADSMGDWVISLFVPTGGSEVIASGSVAKPSKGGELRQAKSACETALVAHLSGSDRNETQKKVTTHKTL